MWQRKPRERQRKLQWLHLCSLLHCLQPVRSLCQQPQLQLQMLLVHCCCYCCPCHQQLPWHLCCCQ